MTTNMKNILLRRAYSGAFAAVGALLCAPTPAQAQTQEFFACYVPNSGVVYRVNPPGSPGESPDLKDDCTGKKHVKFSWAALAVANGKVGAFDVDGTVGASAFASASPLILEAPKKTERMRIDDNTGNVGIGTTSPGEKLTVAGTIESTTGGFKFPNGTIQTTASAGAGDGHSLDAADGSPTDVLFVSNDGKVGIGTTSPATALDVIGFANESAVRASASPTGSAGLFEIVSSSNPNPALQVTTRGTGPAGRFHITSATNPSPALIITNFAGTGPAISAESGGFGTGPIGGTGPAGLFEINNTLNSSPALSVNTAGTGAAGIFNITNIRNSSTVLSATTVGGGLAFSATSAGKAGVVEIIGSNPQFGISPALFVTQAGGGPAISAESGSANGGPAGRFELNNPLNEFPALTVTTAGTGTAGGFSVNNPNGNSPAVFASTVGTGAALRLLHNGASGNIAEFMSDNMRRARIDKNGRGFFAGGTQTGGADLAEAFEVEEGVEKYEPGDVLVISTRSDRRVERSSEPYSTRVIGVYTTKPGVLLTDRDIDDSLDDTLPVGVVGVISTKVSAENGAIRRGDLLVSASTPGHAMRGTDRDRLMGAVVGKALAEFEGPGTGVILVMVNVR